MILNILFSTFCVFNRPYYFKSWLNAYEEDKSIIKPIIINITDDASLLKWIISRRKDEGNDERYTKNGTGLNQTILENILKNNEQKQLLSILLDDNVSYITKLELIILNNYLLTVDSMISSIKGGGLLDDYNFEDFGDI